MGLYIGILMKFDEKAQAFPKIEGVSTAFLKIAIVSTVLYLKSQSCQQPLMYLKSNSVNSPF
jgi:hypothetical protein